MDLNTDPSGSELLAVVSAVVTIVAAFLTWITAGADIGPIEVNASVSGIEDLGTLTLVLAVIALLIVFAVGFDQEGSLATAVIGIVILAVGVFKITDIGGFASAGIGLYLTIIGGLGVAAGGLVGYAGDEQGEREGLG